MRETYKHFASISPSSGKVFAIWSISQNVYIDFLNKTGVFDTNFKISDLGVD